MFNNIFWNKLIDNYTTLKYIYIKPEPVCLNASLWKAWWTNNTFKNISYFYQIYTNSKLCRFCSIEAVFCSSITKEKRISKMKNIWTNIFCYHGYPVSIGQSFKHSIAQNICQSKYKILLNSIHQMIKV